MNVLLPLCQIAGPLQFSSLPTILCQSVFLLSVCVCVRLVSLRVLVVTRLNVFFPRGNWAELHVSRMRGRRWDLSEKKKKEADSRGMREGGADEEDEAE